MLESKRVFWQFEVEGQFDEEAFKKKIVNATIEYAKEQAKEVEGVMRKVSKKCNKKLTYYLTYKLPSFSIIGSIKHCSSKTSTMVVRNHGSKTSSSSRSNSRLVLTYQRIA